MRVSKETRIGLILLAVFALLFGGELLFEWWRGSEAVVVVANAGATPIENFVLSHGGSRSTIPLIAPGSSVRIFINGRDFLTNGPDTASLAFTFRQEGNPLNSFELPDFSPAQLEREGLMLNVRILPDGQVERFGDLNDDTGPPLTRLYRGLRAWFAGMFSIPSF